MRKKRDWNWKEQKGSRAGSNKNGVELEGNKKGMEQQENNKEV